MPRHGSPRGGSDRGSAAAELVLVTPLCLAFVGVFVVGSQLLLDRQQVDDAARSAVEAAVDGPTPEAATYAATVTGVANAIGNGLACSHFGVSTDTSAFRPGGEITVNVACSAKLPSLAMLALPASVQLSAKESAVLEPYRAIQP
ncbi:MAG: TadE/TadG family type IV pilus assembly protein [Acidimicrobiales bacterium]